MKTLLLRNTTWFLVLAFCFTQVVPTAGANPAKPYTEEDALRVSEKSAADKEAAASPKSVPSGAHERFFTAGPLSPKTSESMDSSEGVKPPAKEEKAVQDPITPRTPEEQASWLAAKEAYAESDATVESSSAQYAEEEAPIEIDHAVFDGNGQHQTILDHGQDPTRDAYTISAWVMVDDMNNRNIILRTDGAGSIRNFSHQLRIQDGHFEHYLYSGTQYDPAGGRYTITGDTQVQAGVWYYVVGVASSNGTMELYVNGQREGQSISVGGALWAEGDRYEVGINSGRTEEGGVFGSYKGEMEHIRIEGRVLTSDEIREQYQRGRDQHQNLPPVVQVITDPATGRGLSVTINEHGIATVKWGDQEYKGYFDPKTNSVTLVTKDDALWTLQFGKNEKGELYLQSFQSRQFSGSQFAEETYTFNERGELTRKDWLKDAIQELCAGGMTACSLNLFGGRSGGTIDYVQINGKTLVSHEKTWSENNGRIRYDHYYGGNDRSESESWYSYNNQGNLLAKSWNSTSGYGGSIFGQETYVHINGRDLVSVRRVWQYNQTRLPLYYEHPMDRDRPIVKVPSDGAELIEIGFSSIKMPDFRYTSYHSETYYNYDSEGNMTAEVNAWEGFDYNGQRHTGASYSIYNSEIGTWETASAEGVDIWQIRSAQDWRIIENAAQKKTVYVGGGVNRWNYTHQIMYVKDASGIFVAKAVYDNVGNVSIVQGAPDVLSGETDDIKFVNGQTVNGYTVYYNEYTYVEEDGSRVDYGYRLRFYDQNWNETAVDFPATDTVTLNGVNYKITIDQNGLLHLEDTLPPVVQAYVDYLRELFAGYKIKVEVIPVICKDGPCPQQYQITVLDPSKNFDPGHLRELVIGMRELKELPTVLSAKFDGIEKVDGALLYAGLGQLSDKPMELFPRIVLTAVDAAGIHFDLLQKPTAHYRVYRNADGTVVLEREPILPPAVQAYVNQLRKLGYDVTVLHHTCTSGGKCEREGYSINVLYMPKILRPGQLRSMSFALDGEGNFVSLASAEFDGIGDVDAQLLHEALLQLEWTITGRPLPVKPDPDPVTAVVGRKILPPDYLDEILHERFIKIDPILVLMTQTVVRSYENGVVSFEHDGFVWKAYRHENGKVIIEKGLPVAIQDYVDALQAQLPGFKVTVVVLRDGVSDSVGYEILIVDAKESLKTPTSGLYQMSMGVSPEGKIDVNTLTAAYYTPTGYVKVDGALLYAALEQLRWRIVKPITEPPIVTVDPVEKPVIIDDMTEILVKLPVVKIDQILILMAQTVVCGFESGVVSFEHDGFIWKASRDADGNVKLERENAIPNIPGLPAEFLPYINAIAEHFGIEVSDILRVDAIEFGMVCLGTGCPSWAIDVQLTASINGGEVPLSGMVNGPRWDLPVVLGAKPLPSGSMAESSVSAETSTELASAPLQSFQIRSVYPRRGGLKFAKRFLGGAKPQGASAEASPVYQQSTSLYASPVFGFEGSALFGNLLKELTR